MEEARRLLAQRSSALAVMPPFLRRLAAVTDAQTAALAQDVATVRDRADTLAEMGYDADADLLRAIAEASDGRPEDALTRIEALLEGPRLDGSTAAEAAALRIGLMLRAGDVDRAAEHVPDLLTRVAPQRLLQILNIGFLGGDAFAHLLAAEARRPAGNPFAAEALAALGGYVKHSGQGAPGARRVANALRSLADAEAGSSDERIDLLTPRERDVLVELSRGGSYGDVARALFVSENTVKTHLSSVYRKLGVERRVDALRIARDHRIL